MIHNSFKKSVIAKMYYKELTGEDITNQEAVNRWRMLRNPDKDILKKVFSEVYKEQKSKLKFKK